MKAAGGTGVSGGRRAALVRSAAVWLVAAVAPRRAVTQGAASAPGSASAVVVWDFDNQTPPGASNLAPAQLDYLRRALGENLSSRLIEGGGVPVVERQRLRDLLAEQKLSTSALADADTRLRLGRIVGASRMVFGGFFAIGDEVQVNMRVVETGTSRVLFSDELTAPAPEVMARAESTQARLIHALGGSAPSARGYPSEVWQAYDRALALSDAGQFEQAVTALERLLAEHKTFTPAERQLVALLDKMRRR